MQQSFRFSSHYFITFHILVLYTLVFLTLSGSSLFSNFFVADALNYYSVIVPMWRESFESIRYAGIGLFGLPISMLVYLVYYIFVGPLGVIFFNFIILSIYGRPIIVLMLPYFLAASLGPSKEILLVVLFIFLVTNINKSNYFLAFFTYVLIFLVRDSYVLIIPAVLFLFFLFKLIPNVFFRILVLFFTPILGWVSVAFFSNLAFFARYSFDEFFLSPFFSYIFYFWLKVFSLAVAFAAKATILDVNNGLSILGFFYFVSGTAIFIVFVDAIYSFAKGSSSFLNLFVILNFVSIAFIGGFSPRYLIPVAFCYMYFNKNRFRFSNSFVLLFLAVLIFSIFVNILARFSGFYEVVDYELPLLSEVELILSGGGV